jgi:hypothetical protein
MNLEQANRILDQHKEGSSVYSLLTISRALFITGDLQNEPEPLGLDGKDTWSQGSLVVSSEGT